MTTKLVSNNDGSGGTRRNWSEQRDGFTHTSSGNRVVTCGPCSYAVLSPDGKQFRFSGRAKRFRNIRRAFEFVEELVNQRDPRQPPAQA